jgi:hypothetical protein
MRGQGKAVARGKTASRLGEPDNRSEDIGRHWFSNWETASLDMPGGAAPSEAQDSSPVGGNGNNLAPRCERTVWREMLFTAASAKPRRRDAKRLRKNFLYELTILCERRVWFFYCSPHGPCIAYLSRGRPVNLIAARSSRTPARPL